MVVSDCTGGKELAVRHVSMEDALRIVLRWLPLSDVAAPSGSQAETGYPVVMDADGVTITRVERGIDGKKTRCPWISVKVEKETERRVFGRIMDAVMMEYEGGYPETEWLRAQKERLALALVESGALVRYNVDEWKAGHPYGPHPQARRMKDAMGPVLGNVSEKETDAMRFGGNPMDDRSLDVARRMAAGKLLDMPVSMRELGKVVRTLAANAAQVKAADAEARRIMGRLGVSSVREAQALAGKAATDGGMVKAVTGLDPDIVESDAARLERLEGQARMTVGRYTSDKDAFLAAARDAEESWTAVRYGRNQLPAMAGVTVAALAAVGMQSLMLGDLSIASGAMTTMNRLAGKDGLKLRGFSAERRTAGKERPETPMRWRDDPVRER